MPDEAAIVFDKTRPKLAVGTHLKGSTKFLEEKMRSLYSGRFIAGEDMMTFEIGSEVTRI